LPHWYPRVYDIMPKLLISLLTIHETAIDPVRYSSFETVLSLAMAFVRYAKAADTGTSSAPPNHRDTRD
jgi:hypothetical protein